MTHSSGSLSCFSFLLISAFGSVQEGAVHPSLRHAKRSLFNFIGLIERALDHEEEKPPTVPLLFVLSLLKGDTVERERSSFLFSLYSLLLILALVFLFFLSRCHLFAFLFSFWSSVFLPFLCLFESSTFSLFCSAFPFFSPLLVLF